MTRPARKEAWEWLLGESDTHSVGRTKRYADRMGPLHIVIHDSGAGGTFTLCTGADAVTGIWHPEQNNKLCAHCARLAVEHYANWRAK